MVTGQLAMTLSTWQFDLNIRRLPCTHIMRHMWSFPMRQLLFCCRYHLVLVKSLHLTGRYGCAFANTRGSGGHILQ